MFTCFLAAQNAVILADQSKQKDEETKIITKGNENGEEDAKKIIEKYFSMLAEQKKSNGNRKELA